MADQTGPSGKYVKKTDQTYHELNLEQKVKLIKDYETDPKASYLSLSKKFSCGKSSVGRIIRGKAAILDQYEQNVASKRFRKTRKVETTHLNSLMKEWFDEARSKNIPLTGPLCQEMALRFAENLHLPDFHASSGWLYNWQKANNIHWSVISGESADANVAGAEEFRTRIKELCSGYEPKDVYNLDETALFWRGLPSRSLVAKGDQCKGGKLAKERVTILFTVNQDGSDKQKPLVIGKAARPRAFKNLDLQRDLPVAWESNNKAWMTRKIFEPFLRKFDREMVSKKRKVILFMDNVLMHKIEDLNLKAVKIVFFPPNATSQVQPLDLGIIRAFKAIFKKFLLQKLLDKMEQVNTASDVIKKITLLDAVHWVAAAWKKLSPHTIENCFKKAGFPAEMELESEEDSDEEDGEPELFAGITSLLVTVPGAELGAEDFVNAENDLSTEDQSSEVDQWSRDLLLDFISRNELDVEIEVSSDHSDHEEDEVEEIEGVPDVTHGEARLAIQKLRNYSLGREPRMMDTVLQIERKFESLTLDRKISGRQSNIEDFLQ